MLPYPIIPPTNIPQNFGYQSSVGYGQPANTSNNSANMRPEEPSHPLKGIPFKFSPALEKNQQFQKNDPLFDNVKLTIQRIQQLLDNGLIYDTSCENNFLREHRNH